MKKILCSMLLVSFLACGFLATAEASTKSSAINTSTAKIMLRSTGPTFPLPMD